ncbi:MAG: class I SAM-dependent methyltransferase [Proteobacteria bacterium]|nr:class I SAM-dependent methyltransferase [Pseudomonadota bacterium]
MSILLITINFNEINFMKAQILRIYLSLMFFGSLNASSNNNCSDPMIPETEIQPSYLVDTGIVTKETLLTCFPEDEGRRSSANMILTKIFEAPPRYIMEGEKNPNGCAFTLNPEFLFPLLCQAQGKAMCEIAGASGEHALLFLLAGASSVVINDINKEEVDKALQLWKDTFSPEFKKHTKNRIRFICGDCFEVFNNCKHESMYDIVLARNLIHFFTNEQRSNFFTLLSRITKKNALIHIVTNALKDFAPDITCAKVTTLFNQASSNNAEQIGNPYIEAMDEKLYKPGFKKELFLTSQYPNPPKYYISPSECPSSILALAKTQLNTFQKHYTRTARETDWFKGIEIIFSLHTSMNRFYKPETLIAFLKPFGYQGIQMGLVNNQTGHLANQEDCSLSSAVTLIKVSSSDFLEPQNQV